MDEPQFVNVQFKTTVQRMKFGIFFHFSLKRDKPEGTRVLNEEIKPGNNVTTNVKYDSRIYDLKILISKC